MSHPRGKRSAAKRSLPIYALQDVLDSASSPLSWVNAPCLLPGSLHIARTPSSGDSMTWRNLSETTTRPALACHMRKCSKRSWKPLGSSGGASPHVLLGFAVTRSLSQRNPKSQRPYKKREPKGQKNLWHTNICKPRSSSFAVFLPRRLSFPAQATLLNLGSWGAMVPFQLLLRYRASGSCRRFSQLEKYGLFIKRHGFVWFVGLCWFGGLVGWLVVFILGIAFRWVLLLVALGVSVFWLCLLRSSPIPRSAKLGASTSSWWSLSSTNCRAWVTEEKRREGN